MWLVVEKKPVREQQMTFLYVPLPGRYLGHLNLQPSIYAALCEDGFLTLIEYSPTLSGGRHAELIAM